MTSWSVSYPKSISLHALNNFNAWFQAFAAKYRGADKSLARPGRQQARKHVRDTRDFNNIETLAVIEFFFLRGKAPKEIHAILTDTLACFLPDGTKNLSAPLYHLSREYLNSFWSNIRISGPSKPNSGVRKSNLTWAARIIFLFVSCLLLSLINGLNILFRSEQ